MAEQKTKPTGVSVAKFIKGIPDETKRKDCEALVEIMRKITKCEPKMWGPSIVGFGEYHYKYDSGHEGTSCMSGFSPRKQDLTLYIVPGFDKYPDLMKALGKHKTGKSCLYVKKLDEIHLPTLKKLIQVGLKDMKKLVAERGWQAKAQ